MGLALTLSFSALALLAVMALLWSRWPAWLKGLLVAAVAVFHFWVDDVAHNLSGWPTTDPLPERFSLLAVVVEEPSKKSDGALYVWVNAIEAGKPAAQPRAYRLAYTKDLHALLNEGMKKARNGVSQLGSAQPRQGKGGFFAWLKPGDDQVVKLRDMPLPQLPEK